MTEAKALLGAIEAGGTKMNLLIGTGPDDIRAETRIPTTQPEETLSAIIAFFRDARERGLVPQALGIGSFGPVDLGRESPTWGWITTTPKPGWANTDFAPRLSQALDVPVGFDTDVNGAGLGEVRWGAARDCPVCVYVTIGTGIGGGVIVNGRPLHGLIHPEIGHMRVPRGEDAGNFAGACPFHGDCLEGLASGRAIEMRWGMGLSDMPDDHPALDLTADAIAHLCTILTFVASPHRIVLGGGVMKRAGLLDRIRRATHDLLGGYLSHDRLTGDLSDYLVPPALGDRAGSLGALVLAEQALSGA